MNYKGLFQQIMALLSTPRKAWEEIAAREEGREIVTSFVYPLIGLCGMATFIGAFLGKGMNADVFQMALTRCCAIAVALFGGYFLAVYLMKKAGRRWLGRIFSPDTLQVFVGYSMVVTFVLNIISGLISIELLHWILQFYSIVVVFEGVRGYLQVREEKQTSFAIIATLIILLCPGIIEFVFNKLSVILN